MPTLEQLREIGNNRTSGEWKVLHAPGSDPKNPGLISGEDKIITLPGYPYETDGIPIVDAEWICAASAAWDKMLDVIEAAKNLVPQNNPRLGQEIVKGWDKLYFALKALEAAAGEK